MLTAFGSVESATGVLRKDAFDDLTRPVRVPNIEASVRRALGREQVE